MIPLLPPVLPVALGLAQFVPSIARWLGGEGAETVAATVVGLARQVADAPDPVAAIAADPEARRRFEALWAQYETALAAEETRRLDIVNLTARAEAAAGDAYTRRWRPTWGYVTAAAWAVQALAILACLLGATWATLAGRAEAVAALLSGAASLVGALTVQWSVALAVLGVAVSARSADKAIALTGAAPPSLLGALASRLQGGSR